MAEEKEKNPPAGGEKPKEETKAETEEKTKTEEKEVKKEKPKEEIKEKKEIKVPEKFKKLVEEIEKMSVLDLAELVKILEKKFGVSAAAPVVAAAPGAPAAGPAGAPAEEKSIFNIELTAVGDKKIEVIKVVRDAAGKGLKEAKDLVDAVASGPQMVKENVKKEEAEELKKKFETAGAKVELK
jgi:large subunit ribosomal protein L7/L12